MTKPGLPALFVVNSISNPQITGAFRSLHCLIYKVLAPLRLSAVPEYLTTSLPVCQALFSTFFKVFSDSTPQFSSLGQVLARASQRRNIRYLTTFAPVCQALFSTSSKFFLRLTPGSPVSPTAQLDYHILPTLSIPSPYFFRLFFNFPSATAGCHILHPSW